MAETVLGHRPGLDGLRGLAVAAVLVAHSEIHGPFPMAGAVGVTVFFVLSGFLITKLLLEEDRISLRGFYERRARRLLPALPLALGLCAVVSASIGVAVWRDLAAATFYASNVEQIASGGGGAFRHLWSLAIEEHFYAVWPLVVVACRPRLLRVCLAASAAIVVARIVGPWAGDTMYRATPLRLDAMLAGCALAVVMHAGRLPRFRWTGLAWLVVVVGALDVGKGDWMRWVAPAVAVAAVMLIADQLERPSLTHPALRRLGRISYGVYLIHYPVSLVVRRGLDGFTSFAVTVAVTLALAELSYRVVEARWLRHPVQGKRAARHEDGAAHRGETDRVDRVGSVLPHALHV